MAMKLTQSGMERLGLNLANDILDAATLRLFSNNHTVGQSTKLSDLTECTYDGYANAPIASGNEPYLDDEGGISVGVNSVQFNFEEQPIGEGHPEVISETVYGYYIVNDDGDELLAAANLDNPKTMAGPLDSITVSPLINFPRSAQ